jgi:hypothetical protein
MSGKKHVRRRSKLIKSEREDIKNKIKQLLDSGVKSPVQIANTVGVTPATALSIIREIKLESKLAGETEEGYEKDETESKKFVSTTKVEVPFFGVLEKITLDPDILIYWSFAIKEMKNKSLEQMTLNNFISKAIREYFEKKE